eukprot:CAMPEP_0118652108 /NCGR_PEP_ID=MMETSP0785-20121206/11140_1 /TAXON_ID=91992 /ORGANISM="Bolidomonas pacifica, Strain CCMP 1866" /LENGTH=589 /DNA_ID=CAMNT_0006544599 /DNA_START=78 /DNA_END=1845 /DNA_ORIENTATION=+
MSAFTSTAPQLNSRCRDVDGFLGTVLYVGPVASAKKQGDIYCGIEWDDPSRGKHDGSVISRETNDIVRHFKCNDPSPTAGSFVKPNKLDFGVSFCSVLARTEDAPLLAPNDKFEGCFARTKSGRGKQVEFFGERKIRSRQQVGDITKVSLRGLGVSHAGDDTKQINTQAGHLTEVDLQGNMLWDWEEVMKIMCEIPNLEAVHLNGNRLRNPSDPKPQTMEKKTGEGGFTNLKRLVINKTGIKGWNAVEALGAVFPNLTELYCADNDLADVDIVAPLPTGITGFSNLKLLDLSSCGLTSWSQVKTFGNMKGLETLIVNENDIQETEECEEGTFENLKALQISKTKIKEWKAVDNLNSYPSLRALRFNNCPLTSTMGGSEARGIVIARVEKVEFLNASVVTKKERGDAEKIYVRRVAREVQMKAGGDDSGDKDKRDAVLKSHPRFKHLKEVHKASMVPLGDGGGTGNLASDTINVTVQSMAAGSCTMEPIRKRVPSSLQLGRLKQICKRAFKLDPDLQVLHFRADKGSLSQELGTGADDDDLTLAYFGVTDGSMIMMNEVDLKAKERERVAAEKARKEEEEREKEQEEETN